MLDIKLIGFTDIEANRIENELKDIFKNKDYYSHIYLTKYLEPYTTTKNLQTNERAPYFLIIDQNQENQERAKDILNELNKRFSDYFTATQLFDDTNLYL